MKRPTEPVPYLYQPYPRWKYGPKGASMLVQDAAEEAALCPGWYDSPAEVPTSMPTASLPTSARSSQGNDGLTRPGSPEPERWDSGELVCNSCGRVFTHCRPWQRGCGSPACRAGASRRRQQRQLRELFNQLEEALARGNLEGAQASLQILVATLT
jgi:hypothetical protein